MPYCKARTGISSKIRFEISLTASIGNAAASGLPAAKGITDGSLVALSISLMADGLSEDILSEKT